MRAGSGYVFSGEGRLQMLRVITAAAVACVAVLVFAEVRAAEEKATTSIKDVMKLHKDKLNEKFAEGKATKEEKQKLHHKHH